MARSREIPKNLLTLGEAGSLRPWSQSPQPPALRNQFQRAAIVRREAEVKN